MATIIGTVCPTIMLYPPFVEAMAQCRVELVKRESDLLIRWANGNPSSALPSKLETALAETRAEIARIDNLFNPPAK